MGSNQSSDSVASKQHTCTSSEKPSASVDERSVRSDFSSAATAASADAKRSPNKKSRNPPTPLTSYDQVERRCRRKKRAYDRCYARWYSGTFVSGEAGASGGEHDSLSSSREGCDDLFEVYRDCYLRGVAEVRKNRGTGKAKEGSLLAEFEEEEEP